MPDMPRLIELFKLSIVTLTLDADALLNGTVQGILEQTYMHTKIR
jgi:hypothetical protein